MAGAAIAGGNRVLAYLVIKTQQGELMNEVMLHLQNPAV